MLMQKMMKTMRMVMKRIPIHIAMVVVVVDIVVAALLSRGAGRSAGYKLSLELAQACEPKHSSSGNTSRLATRESAWKVKTISKETSKVMREGKAIVLKECYGD
jgi:hypothetical protein